MNKIIRSKNIFESIKHIDEYGIEYWYARELMVVLEYKKWQKFLNVIKDSKEACKFSNNLIDNHFTQVGKMIRIAKGANRSIVDYKLSRFACYLIAQNSDPRKEAVALAQTYFAIQTRRQEFNDLDYESMTEDEKRIFNRELARKGNYSLNHTAAKAGVRNFAKFHNAGYKGLYNGETADDIARRKRLRYREEILDNMGSVELAANIFRISQTDEKLKNDKIKGENKATETHYIVGKKVRETIKELGGTMPEDLPTPKKSLKEIKITNKLSVK